MKKFGVLALASMMALMAQASVAQSPPSETVLGVVSAVTPTEVDVTAADGTKSIIALTAKTRYVSTMPMSIDDIKTGSYIGAGAMADGKGGNTAIEITIFPESARGLAEGFSTWNQGPDSTMTNGTVQQVVGTNNRTLTVTYKGGQQTVTIPDGTPVTTFAPTNAAALTVGSHVSVRAFKGTDGTLTAAFVSIGANGYAPTT